MVAFRGVGASVPRVTDWWTDGSNQIAFGRGDRGFVVVNREGATLDRRFQTSLAPGRYCDVIGGDLSGGACSGTVVVVDSGGTAEIAAPPEAAVAIHAGAVLP
jgi:alpha-amylase